VENCRGNRRSTKINWKSTPGTYTRDELPTRLAGLRKATIDQTLAPHIPLLLFGQSVATSSSATCYQQAEEPASQNQLRWT
jgi:hypothetical protein